MAMSGKMSRSILEVMCAEDFQYEGSEFISHRSNIKQNMGTFLLRLGNEMTDYGTYSLLYNQSEALLLAALKLRPSNWQAKENLDTVRKNRKARAGMVEAASTAQPMDVAEANPQLAPFDPSTAYFILSTMYGGENNDPHPLLEYDHALQQAMQGHVDDGVVRSMRKELRRYERSGDAEGAHRVELNLGAALLNLANRADS